MTVEYEEEPSPQELPRRGFPTRADFWHYAERRGGEVETGNWVSIDKTTAMVLGAIASAGLAVAVAGGTALVQKVDDTAKEVEKGRTERIASLGEVSKNVSVMETKISQLITQLSQLEDRVERTVSHDFEARDKKIERLESAVDALRERVGEVTREQRKPQR